MKSKELKIGKVYHFGWVGFFGKYHEDTMKLLEIIGTHLIFGFKEEELSVDYKDITWISSNERYNKKFVEIEKWNDRRLKK